MVLGVEGTQGTNSGGTSGPPEWDKGINVSLAGGIFGISMQRIHAFIFWHCVMQYEIAST